MCLVTIIVAISYHREKIISNCACCNSGPVRYGEVDQNRKKLCKKEAGGIDTIESTKQRLLLLSKLMFYYGKSLSNRAPNDVVHDIEKELIATISQKQLSSGGRPLSK